MNEMAMKLDRLRARYGSSGEVMMPVKDILDVFDAMNASIVELEKKVETLRKPEPYKEPSSR